MHRYLYSLRLPLWSHGPGPTALPPRACRRRRAAKDRRRLDREVPIQAHCGGLIGGCHSETLQSLSGSLSLRLPLPVGPRSRRQPERVRRPCRRGPAGGPGLDGHAACYTILYMLYNIVLKHCQSLLPSLPLLSLLLLDV